MKEVVMVMLVGVMVRGVGGDGGGSGDNGGGVDDDGMVDVKCKTLMIEL